MCCGCNNSYKASIHVQCQASIYTLLLCRGHSLRVRLATQETLTQPGHLVSPLVCRGQWISTVVLYSWCHSDSSTILLYFTYYSIMWETLICQLTCKVFLISADNICLVWPWEWVRWYTWHKSKCSWYFSGSDKYISHPRMRFGRIAKLSGSMDWWCMYLSVCPSVRHSIPQSICQHFGLRGQHLR